MFLKALLLSKSINIISQRYGKKLVLQSIVDLGKFTVNINHHGGTIVVIVKRDGRKENAHVRKSYFKS